MNLKINKFGNLIIQDRLYPYDTNMTAQTIGSLDK